MIWRLFAAVFVLMLNTAGVATPERLVDPKLETRAVELQKQLRCLVCQGESLDESSAPLAADLRRVIRERIKSGDSDDAVKHYLVARYGEFILMKPPVEKDTYLLWFAPLLLIAIGGMVLTFVAWRAHRRFSTETRMT